MLTVQGSYWKSRVESPTFVHSLRLLLRAPLGGKPIFSPWIQQTIEEIIENRCQYNQNMINSKCKIHLEINTWNSKEVFHYKKIGLAFRKHLRVEAFEGELEPQKALVQKRPLSEAKTMRSLPGERVRLSVRACAAIDSDRATIYNSWRSKGRWKACVFHLSENVTELNAFSVDNLKMNMARYQVILHLCLLLVACTYSEPGKKIWLKS